MGAAATAAAVNAAVASAPGLPGNDLGVGGAAVTAIAAFTNAVVQALKFHGWFRQNTWATWVVIALALAIALAIWHDNLRLAVLNGMAAAANAALNYHPLARLGVLRPAPD